MKLVDCFQDAYILESVDKENKKKLTIVCHGLPGRVIINNRILNAAQLYRYIPHWTTLSGLHKIHLVACDSATRMTYGDHRYLSASTPDSIGIYLSMRLPSVYIKCYSGKVTNQCSTDLLWPIHCALGQQQTEEIIRSAFKVLKDNVDSHYHAVTYHNGDVFRQKYPVIRHNNLDYGVL